MNDCIQSVMGVKRRCPECDVALKSLYDREGAKGYFRKAGLKCPKCGRLFKLNEKYKKNVFSKSIIN